MLPIGRWVDATAATSRIEGECVPFRSERQRRFLWARHPDIARRWTAEYGSKIEPRKQAVANENRRRKRKRPS